MKKKRSSALVLVLLIIIAAPAQSNSQEKPKKTDFGSSLKKLKWDPVRQATSEIKEQRKVEDRDDVIRVETRLVVSDLLVLDGQQKPVTNLTAEDFVVTEDNQPQTISHFSRGDDRDTPRSIILIIDHSWSQLPYLRTSLQAAQVLVDKLGPLDRMAIVTDDVSLALNFTSDKQNMKTALETLRVPIMPGTPGMVITTSSNRTGILQQENRDMMPPPRQPSQTGYSDPFSALFATVRELVSADDIRPIIIFQSDGDELNFLQPPNLHRSEPPLSPSSSKEEKKRWQDAERRLRPRVKQYSLDDILAALQKSRVTVYSVIPGIRYLGVPEAEQKARTASLSQDSAAAAGSSPMDNSPAEPRFEFVGFRLDTQSAMARAATVSGGWTAFLEEPKQAETIYSHVLDDVNSRYVVGYYPTNKAKDGTRHTFTVQIRNHPDYTINGRKIYYAPGPD
ncbi:MAG TPA: VWA domain-containing protein [Pyrinomonadaceae bacterium]|nr:VWA domain-containing protein [Pyrinomonadaceae bacterium]